MHGNTLYCTVYTTIVPYHVPYAHVPYWDGCSGYVSARQAAGSNRGELKRSAVACGADRSGSPGVAWRIPRLAGSGPGWTTPHWSKVVQGGPGWSRVVQGGPGSAVWEGGSPSSPSDVQTTRKTIPRRLAEYGPR